MGLTVVYGDATRDHDRAALAMIKRERTIHPQSQVFIVVPDQVKFEAEVHFLQGLAGNSGEPFASGNVQVFSVSRLAWYFLRDDPAMQRSMFSNAGLTMLVSDLLQQIPATQLRVFAGERNHPGFAKQLATQLIELRQGGFTPADLQALQSQVTDPALQAKLADLGAVYAAFVHVDLKNYVDPTTVTQRLVDHLRHQTNLQQTTIAFLGFDHFSAVEHELIRVLLSRTRQVIVSLVMSPAARQLVEDQEMVAPNYLYYQPVRIARRLRASARQAHVTVTWQVAPGRSLAPVLQQIAQQWERRYTGQIPSAGNASATECGFTVTQLMDRAHEVKWIAGQIRQLVATQHLRYRDIAVFVPSMAPYANLIEPFFTQQDVPVFVDQQHQMGGHPLVALITTLLAIYNDGQHYDFTLSAMMRLLKTELLVPKFGGDDAVKQHNLGTFRATLDVVENYLLARGINHLAAWQKEWMVVPVGSGMNPADRRAADRINRNANVIRQAVVNWLLPFFTRVKEAKSGNAFAQALMDFLVDSGVQAQLEGWQHTAEYVTTTTEEHFGFGGATADPTRPQQVWNQLCRLLDEYVATLGERKFDVSVFAQLFTDGFATATYSRIPAMLDQVIVSSLNGMHLRNKKVVFIMGATAADLPGTVTQNTILSADDRLALATRLAGDDGPQLADGADLQMATAPYRLFRDLLVATDALFITFPVNGRDGVTYDIAPVIAQVAAWLNVAVKQVRAVPAPTDSLLPYGGTAQGMLGALITQCRQALQEGTTTLSVEWRALLHRLGTIPQARAALAGLTYVNAVLPASTPVKGETTFDPAGDKQLAPALVPLLYGKRFRGSVSSIQEFWQNPYAFFLNHGLRLRPRAVFKVDPLNTGNYLHRVMEIFVKKVVTAGATLRTLPHYEFDRLFAQALVQVQQEDDFAVFRNSARNQYLQYRMNQTLHGVTGAFYRQERRQPLFPVAAETKYGGHNAPLRALHLGSGSRQMNVNGKIDRIDVVTTPDGQLYYNVVDYKSSNPTNNYLDHFIVRLKNGLSLQLLTYLNVLRQPNNYSRLHQLIEQAGISQFVSRKAPLKFYRGSGTYVTVRSPQVGQSTVKSGATPLTLLNDQFKYNGLFTKDQENTFLNALTATTLNITDDGQVVTHTTTPPNVEQYGLGTTKQNEFKGRGKSLVLTPGDFEMLLDYDLYKLDTARQLIYDGVISMYPYRLHGVNAVQQSDYQQVMLFDPALGNTYHDLDQEVAAAPRKLAAQLQALENDEQFIQFIKQHTRKKEEATDDK
ncbi:PD-(D/E)XK nuclease family protein [Ligilactobacillus sp. LYQ60]|uniref:PD-(D/E)XK nuclease family protein n=1 Tax=Ligilactobacillus sp. LYQ60 TaxID=3378799 RepID=UPI0038550158